MSNQLPASLERLARSNPIAVDDDRGRQAVAQTALAKVLASERPTNGRIPRRRTHRPMIIALAALLLAGGAALAATDPFGFWRSTNPGTALYGVDTTRHVQTPTAQQIGCERSTAVTFICRTRLKGLRYILTGPIQAPAKLTRTTIVKALVQEARRGQISLQAKRRFEVDLAAVPDSFLSRLSEAMHFGTYSGGREGTGDTVLVPPPGVPEWLVCAPAGAALSCRDLNGDEHVAIGSGVYLALPSSDWVAAPSSTAEPPNSASKQMMHAIFGGPFTAAEIRLLRDFATAATTTGSSSSSRPLRAARSR